MIGAFAGPIYNYLGQDKLNHDSRNFALMQGDIEQRNNIANWNMQNERDDQVWNRQNDYNLKMWQMQNEYNSPAAQMARYKEAGLNPNLIYGQSNTGASFSTANAPHQATPKGGRPGSWAPKFIPQNFDFANGIQSYLDLKAKAAQVDNLKATNDAIKQDTALKNAQTLNELLGRDFNAATLDGRVSLLNKQSKFYSDTYDDRVSLTTYDKEKKMFDYQLQMDLKPYVLEAARQNVRKMKNLNTHLEWENDMMPMTAALLGQNYEYKKAATGAIDFSNLSKDAQTNLTKLKQSLLKNPESNPYFWLEVGKSLFNLLKFAK